MPEAEALHDAFLDELAGILKKILAQEEAADGELPTLAEGVIHPRAANAVEASQMAG